MIDSFARFCAKKDALLKPQTASFSIPEVAERKHASANHALLRGPCIDSDAELG